MRYIKQQNYNISMKWILTLESFISRIPRRYFVKYSDSLSEMSGMETSLNFKIMNVLIKELFDEIIILEEMTMGEINDWINSLQTDDVVWSYSSRFFNKNYSNHKNKKIEVLNYVFKKLSRKKGIKFQMNDTFTKSKTDYYNIFKDYEFMPKTCFSKEEALETLTFPIVAKPDDGSKGFGIKKFKTKEEFKSSRLKFDLYSEYVEHICEFRVFVLHGKVIYIVERIPKYEDKNNIDSKSKDDIIKFAYIPQEIVGFPYLRKIQNVAKTIDEKLGSHVNAVYSIDLFITPDEKVKVIESNSKSELGPYEFMEICKNLYDTPYHINILMEKIKNLYIGNEYKEFKEQIKKSVHPISYKTYEVDDELLKFINSYNSKKL